MIIMCWNIQRFRYTDDFYAAYNRNLIIEAIYPGGATNPAVDALAILEVFDWSGEDLDDPLPPESLGTSALSLIHRDLRARSSDGGPDWRLIPPRSLGLGRRNEGIGVFYNARSLTWTGPDCWTADGAVPYTGQATIDYPEPWNNLMPSPYYAARASFTDWEHGTKLTFPDDSHRRPWLVRFSEGSKTVDVLFFHTSPPLRMDPEDEANPAFLACKYLERATEVHNPTHDGITGTVIIGDLNVNANRPDQFNNALGGLGALGYSTLLPVTGGGQQAIPTTLKRRGAGAPVPPNPIPPPACNAYYWDKWAIDNALYSSGLSGGGAVIDRTAGTNVPQGHWPSVMRDSIASIRETGSPWPVFWANCNHYQNRRRSDHVAIVIRV
jgi:hypothetical protein